MRPSGHQAGAYLNWRFEPTTTLTTDLGLRWDRETLAAQDGSQTSPRAVVMWRPGEDTRLRLSWALYFEIQALNQYGGESLAALADAVLRLQALVSNQDAAGFVRLMRRGQAYLQDRAAARQT